MGMIILYILAAIGGVVVGIVITIALEDFISRHI